MRLIILLLNIFLCSAAWATSSFWTDQTNDDSLIFTQNKAKVEAAKSNVRTLHLDEAAFKQLLNTAFSEDLNLNNSDRKGMGLTIKLPLPDGDFATLYVEESTVMSPVLAAKFPNIKTWRVWGDHKKVRSGRIDFTSKGFHAMLTMSNGDTTYIDPKTDSFGSKAPLYQSTSLHKKDQENEGASFTCNHVEHMHGNAHIHNNSFSKQLAALTSTSGSIQTYRLAVAATGAFTAQNGGTKESALASIVTVINRINEIYQRDVAIKLVLVANNDAIIYTDVANDPYGTNSLDNLSINQNTLDNVIGSANYDIGHVFDFVSTISANGLAQVASVCDNTSKAKASSGFRSDLDRFATTMVAHEIGHQFGATHSFNSSSDICGLGNNRTATSAYEPGSGTSIMSYAGICGLNNIQSSNDPYFHSGSIQQIAQYTRTGNGALCASKTFQNNTDPRVEAGANYTIPANTPIELKGSASDSNTEDSLSYSWEQLNTTTAPSDVNVDDGKNAIFRIYPPVASATRTIPNLSSLYSGISAKGDLPPQQSRLTNPLIMALLVRDQKAGAGLDTSSLFVSNTGRSFSITSHQTDTNVFKIGEATTVTWDVANTNQSPIACNAVDIYLVIGDPRESDTPVETLLVTTDNDGKATVALRSNISSTQRARIKVKCNTNIFFALSPINFSIEGTIEGTIESVFADASLTTSTENSSGGGGSLNGLLFGLLLVLASFKQFQRYVGRRKSL